jgi:hypothetical protein
MEVSGSAASGLVRTHARITSQNAFANLTEEDLTNAQFPMLNSHPRGRRIPRLLG